MPGTSLLLHLLSPLYGAGAEDRWGEKAGAEGKRRRGVGQHYFVQMRGMLKKREHRCFDAGRSLGRCRIRIQDTGVWLLVGTVSPLQKDSLFHLVVIPRD